MLKDIINNVAANYLDAKISGNGSLIRLIEKDAPAALKASLASLGHQLLPRGRRGGFKWATIPLFSLLDPVVTDSTQQGYYVVYLFSADMKRVYLSLNQGATQVKAAYKSQAKYILKKRAQILREIIPEYQHNFSSTPINLSSSGEMPGFYEAGHAFGKSYELPLKVSDSALVQDLREMATLYLEITRRGGIQPTRLTDEPDFYQVLLKLRDIEKVLNRVIPAPDQIGHNMPPEAMEASYYTEKDDREARYIINIIREQNYYSSEPPKEVKESPGFFKKLGEQIQAYLTSEAKVAAKGAIRKAARPVLKLLAGKCFDVAHEIWHWLSSL